MTPNHFIWQAILVSSVFCFAFVGCNPTIEPNSLAPEQPKAIQKTTQENTPSTVIPLTVISAEPESLTKPAIEPIDQTSDPAGTPQTKPGTQEPAPNPPEEIQTIDIPKTWKRLGKKEEIWIDVDSKEVIFAGHVCLNAGALEMFICPEQTKEHESVISAHATALQVHLALVALGANPGKATSWDPEYRAAYGPTIEITLKWKDPDTGKTKTTSAKQWIRNVKTKKAMEQAWVFGGSQFWNDPNSKKQVYYGDAGELICLSNFSTATIDLNIQSSQSNEGLLFEAFEENIPPLETKVYAIVKPGKRIEPKKVKQTPKEKSDREIKQPKP
ncbi:YdjY domain-containing protein [Mariniblastus sp.]|jgi:hypothetical protein|nr:YdjY domain-containing protein [Mariniblastus sp.]